MYTGDIRYNAGRVFEYAAYFGTVELLDMV